MMGLQHHIIRRRETRRPHEKWTLAPPMMLHQRHIQMLHRRNIEEDALKKTLTLKKTRALTAFVRGAVPRPASKKTLHSLALVQARLTSFARPQQAQHLRAVMVRKR